ncbi:MAG: hypothetical protein HY525_07220 [Betaproteobacteria bacterium]|nr:hypothetical protein [Betaproteobacteria bacterium]
MERIDAKLAQAVVLLSRQYLLTDHLIETRGYVLREFERAIEEKRQALDHVLDVYNYVFALIDHLVRYEKIAFVLPRLNQKIAEYRALRDAMGELKDIRNQLQHINNDVENDNSGPLLGAVCWVSGQRQFIASFHDIGRRRSSPGIILDTRTGTFAQEFCYFYNDAYHDLGRAIEGVRTFNKFVNSQVHVEVDGKLLLKFQCLLCLSGPR